MTDAPPSGPPRIDRAFALVERAVVAGRIPGAVLGVIAADGTRQIVHAGRAATIPDPAPMRDDTVFDLASLTKPVFTAEAILALVEEGAIALDDPLTTLIPDLCQYHGGGWQRDVTFRDCLAHRTAFPNVHPVYTYGSDPATLRAFVLQRDWRRGPAVYSDLNFILLGIALERHHGRPLREMTPPPGFTFSPDPGACAATEACAWRGRVLRGEVHDENAFALRGAGHAGLFGTAGALLDFAARVLDRPADHPVRTPVAGHETQADRLTSGRAAPVTRTHGWELRHDGWSGGDAAGEGAIGHTGFTGTGLWVDFAHGHAWTLLTNRVHPTRHAESGIVELRRAVGDALNDA
ncbi:serine hydrolase domain-containing protein [Wenxinia saemankumensis]|uniref:CubicO group peptidase, beta-lactamase class C family n=1 Tax=Wenxinia saemankumensis TaxID=1447782 RepID=A0A1M6A2Z9_9RHOB|nr:serine hydrolase domain-containing protein [Wenxinia saemankumensis]SHI30835.1 CubicO group peptidase, beta-lactamase class C family [Wenxinia saemankumensis]